MLALLAVVIGGASLGSALHSTGTLHRRLHTVTLAITPVASNAHAPAVVNHVRTELHLNIPVYQQYLLLVSNLLQHGSFGYSFVNGTPVP